jgi:outer membrane protein assembly factor BamB
VGRPAGRGRKAEVVKVWRRPAVWARLALLAVFLLAAVVIPGRATSQQTPHCVGLRCTAAGSVLWTTPLPGSWTAEPGVLGTVTEPDAAYAADDGVVAAVGSQTSVTGFDATTGKALWHVSLSGLLPGSVIVSVRAFSGVVAVGVQPPPGQGGPAREEVILAAATGSQIRTYPAASYGGAVRADAATTVIVGNSTVTAYANATGRPRWQRGLGAAGATWRAFGQYIYVTNPASAGVAAIVRQISLVTGSERIVRAQRGVFAGSLADVVDTPVLTGPAATVLLFAGASRVTAYGLDGRPRWHKNAAVVELADAAKGVVYLAEGAKLTGIDAASGSTVSSVAISVAASLYWISGGVALGLDQNALGEAWGYSLAARRVAWTSVGLPWPHYFADLSGLGGSASGAGDVALLAVCALTGAAPAASVAPPCRRPELAAVLIRSR